MTAHTSPSRSRTSFLATLLVVATSTTAWADLEGPALDGADAGGLEFETERVVVFKDGHGLFVKKATGTTDAEGRLSTDAVPDAAVLGSFWAVADDHDAVNLKAEWIDREVSSEKVTDCVTRTELLRANEGRPLSLDMNYGETITGTLLNVLEMPAGQGQAGPGGQLAVMHTPGGTKVLPIGSVRTITGDDLVSTMTRKTRTTTRTKRLWFELGAQAADREVSIHLFYFTPGIRWIPTYRLGGELKYDGRLSLQGEILNEVEDIDGAVFDLVVGVPNFRYKGTISPLSLERVMVDALRQNAPGLMGQRMGNASFSQRAGEWRGDDGRPAPAGGGGMAALASELTAAGEQDLFVYSVERMSLARGARATVSLWQSNVPLRHLYTMDVDIVRDRHSGARIRSSRAPNEPGNPSPLRLAENEVWHQLELANTSDVPWTTGPAMLMRSFLPLGQELLTYTPLGGRSLVPITVAVDVRGTYEEEEIEREPDALRWNGYQWALVRKKGTVTVTNYRSEPTDMLVTVGTGGKAESASDDARIKINATRVEDWNGGHAAIN
ncbi:MAG: hypothetical protein ACYSU7_16730, partial [Planctomycetota bacterium]